MVSAGANAEGLARRGDEATNRSLMA